MLLLLYAFLGPKRARLASTLWCILFVTCRLYVRFCTRLCYAASTSCGALLHGSHTHIHTFFTDLDVRTSLRVTDCVGSLLDTTAILRGRLHTWRYTVQAAIDQVTTTSTPAVQHNRCGALQHQLHGVQRAHPAELVDTSAPQPSAQH